jgi:uncharacterized protein
MSAWSMLLYFSLFFLISCNPNPIHHPKNSLPSKNLFKQRTETKVDIPVIDAHVHIKYKGDSGDPSKDISDEQKYFQESKAAGVVGSVSHTPQGTSGITAEESRTQKVIYCAGIGQTVNVQRLEADLKAKKFACIKIYLGYIAQYAYDPNYTPAYQLAQKYDVPVVFHTGDTNSTTALLKYADPLTIDEVAVKFPQVNFVIAHCGNPWIESAAEVAYKNPNVYLDGSALLIGDLSRLAPEDVDAYLIRPLRWIFGYVENPRKLMFGTDWPLTAVGPYLEAFKKAIPEDSWKDVLYNNAVRVFKFPGMKLLP